MSSRFSTSATTWRRWSSSTCLAGHRPLLVASSNLASRRQSSETSRPRRVIWLARMACATVAPGHPRVGVAAHVRARLPVDQRAIEWGRGPARHPRRHGLAGSPRVGHARPDDVVARGCALRLEHGRGRPPRARLRRLRAWTVATSPRRPRARGDRTSERAWCRAGAPPPPARGPGSPRQTGSGVGARGTHALRQPQGPDVRRSRAVLSDDQPRSTRGRADDLIQAGTYPERSPSRARTNVASRTKPTHLVMADPRRPPQRRDHGRDVGLYQRARHPSPQSKYVTLRGLTITGRAARPSPCSGQQPERAIHIERNGSSTTGGRVQRWDHREPRHPGRSRNNLIYGNGRNSITFLRRGRRPPHSSRKPSTPSWSGSVSRAATKCSSSTT